MDVSRRQDLWAFALLFASLEVAFLIILQVLYYPPEMHAYILAREPLLTVDDFTHGFNRVKLQTLPDDNQWYWKASHDRIQ